MYIKNLKDGNDSLEKQGDRLGGEKAKKALGFSSKKKIIFVPLQRPSDTVIKFFSGSVGSVKNFIQQVLQLEKLLNKDSSDWFFLLKKHPLETEYFSFESDNVGYVPDDTNMYDLIEMSTAVLLINSGVGLNALAYEKKVICMGQSFYASPGLAIHAESVDQAYEIITNPEKTSSYLQVSRFFNHLVEKVYSFGKFETELVADQDGSFRNVTNKICFNQVRWLGVELRIKHTPILVVSPLIPYPIYRGNQTRIDSFVRWLISNDYIVDLLVLNTSFPNKKSQIIKEELEAVYGGINSVTVVKSPALEKDYVKASLKSGQGLKIFYEAAIQVAKGAQSLGVQMKQGKLKKNKISELVKVNDQFVQEYKVFNSYISHNVNAMGDKISNREDTVVSEKNCPSKFVRAAHMLCSKNEYDYILLNYVKTSMCVPETFKGKVIIDTHDYQSLFLEEDQLVNQKQLNVNLELFRKSEHFWLNKADLLISISPVEEVLFKSIVDGGVKVCTVPQFFPRKKIIKPKFWRYNYDVLYVGSLSNFNVSGLKWFLDKVLPIVIEQIPNLRFAIVGSIGRSKEIQWENYGKNIVTLGRVTDLSGLYISSLCCVAPILGGAGMKIKVVEALSYAKATIGTPKALDGINVGLYDAAVCTSDPNEFARAVIKTISDESFRVTLEKNADILFESEHSEKALDHHLKEIFTI